MAYAALLSLSQTIDQILVREEHTFVIEKEKLVSLQKNVSALQTFLEEYWHKCRGNVNPLESRIIDAVYHAENIIEYHMYSILEEATKIKNNPAEENVPFHDLSDVPSLSTDASSDINTMLFQFDFERIEDQIYDESCNFNVILIVGMGGLGKTTLARKLYEDSIKRGYFDRYIWVVASQDYSPKKLLSDIMLSMGKPVIDKNTDKEYTREELEKLIYQELLGGRYMIVVDDLWSEEALNDLNLILPKDTAGSRLMVTSRLRSIGYYDHIGLRMYEMPFLGDNRGWKFLEERIFGKDSSCPRELKQIGQMMLQRCQGLPLHIVVLAGLLKGDTTKEFWEIILESLSHSDPQEPLYTMKVLLLSYNHLPLYLKPCFLYLTVFPEDSEIKANKLIKLWIAEGFVKPSESKSLEEVAEEYLHDLVGRNLFLVSEKTRYKDRIKTIRMHDLVRDFGIHTAQQERFLEKYSQKYKGAVVNSLESRIFDATYHHENITEYQAEDIVEPERDFAFLHDVLIEIDLILEEAMKINNNNDPAENVLLPDISHLSTDNYSDVNTMVLEDDFMLIKERMYNKSCNFEVIPIVGMGGIGKSTLARKLYEDAIKQGHFDRCIWVVVSQDYSQRKLLSEIVLSMGHPATGDLKQIIYQELFSRRYLIVVDDLWSAKAWDDLNLILPKDEAGSRVLVTTRLSEIVSYVGSKPLVMQLMNECQSWTLFEERVFGESFSCPSELKQIGKNVVKSCRGLPLTIVVVAGLLRGETTKEYWETISENISSSEPNIELHCSKVLSLSYNHLSLYLRPCFLSVTAFPEDYEIKANRLIRLWMAEGFVKPSGSKLLEEVAEGYLNDLVGRNLLMVSKKNRYNDRIKTINIHDLLRNFGIKTAQQERFHYHHDLNPEYRRVAIDNHASLDLFLKFRKPATRSVLVSVSLSESRKLSFENLGLLRILDACDIYMKGDASKLVHLRYLSILLADYSFLKSTSELRNIQTLIINNKHIKNELIVPLKFWKSPSVRHLILPTNSRLEQPSEDDIVEETSLQTIRSVTNLRFTKKVLVMLLNLRKLKICYECQGKILPWKTDWVNDYDLINLVHLQKLENLAINFLDITSPRVSDLIFPKSLKKLSLDSIDGRWKDMSVVGSLPNLEVFKLSWFMSREGWEPIEGEFLKLKHLQFEAVFLSYLEAESMHFPSLEILVLKEIPHLNEIPSGIGEIDTLKVIELVDCNKSIVDSAKQIQADLREMGNDDLRLIVSASR